MWQIFAHWGSGMRAELEADFSSKCFYSWMEEWLKKMWYIDMMEYYSDITRNESGSFVETWMDLETVIQNKVNQRKTNVVCYHICLESRKMVQMSLFAKQK